MDTDPQTGVMETVPGMRTLPIFLDIDDKPCLVVGGGEVAARKVNLLRASGGRVQVVAPTLAPGLARLVADGLVAHREATFDPADLEGMHLVIAATDDATVNRQVAQLAKARALPVNVVDHPGEGSFLMPSVVDRSPVTIAVSTGGASPVLARLLRARLESLVPAAYGQLAVLMERFRARVAARMPPAARRRFWDQVLQGNIAELVFAGNVAEADRALAAAIDAADAAPGTGGEVYLVGAGPGDPDLLTFRALRLLQQADVVLYDRLVSEPILALVRRGADRIYVGKARADHAVPQSRINELLVELAGEGKRVLRLKGGDPFIFGRGGEEIEGLMAAGIPFQVVPGITAASGCAAYAGIPLTHRDYSQSCVFVTGHLKSGRMALNWAQVCQPEQTVVVYMGLAGLPELCAELVRHGMPETLPAALVEKGTTAAQRVITATLATLPEAVARAGVSAPTLLIIGNVVRLRDSLNWYHGGRPDPATAST